jgi:hypothetical protein
VAALTGGAIVAMGLADAPAEAAGPPLVESEELSAYPDEKGGCKR